MSRRRAAGLAAIAGLAVAAAARAALFVVEVRGVSMQPTYADGDRLLAVRRWASRPPRTGDVVVVRAPAAAWRPADPLAGATTVVVKRVVEAPAQTDLPPGALWVRGDAADSYDSRRFGAIERRSVLGRVLGRLPRGHSLPR
jgi:signal peptidase I